MVIGVITRGVATGLRIARVTRRFQKKAARLDPGNRFIERYFPPHLRKPAQYVYQGSLAVYTAGVIYDIIQENWNALSPPKQPDKTGKQQKSYSSGRGYNSRSSYGRFRNRSKFQYNARTQRNQRCCCR